MSAQAPQPKPPLWLKGVVSMLVVLVYAALPLVIVAAWQDFRNGPPNFTFSWLFSGLGAFFILMTWLSPLATQLYARNVSGMPFVGNFALGLALLLGPKPGLFWLAFVLDPIIWFWVWLAIWKR